MIAQAIWPAVCLLWFPHSVLAYWNTSVTVSLAWPPVDDQGDVTSWPTPDGQHGVFPCEKEAVSGAALYGPRTDFPLTGGRFQFDLGNSTSQLSGQKFYVTSYFGHMSIDASPDNSGWAYISTLVYNYFTTGPSCTDAVDVPDVLQNRPYFTSTSGNAPSALEGANVTLGLTIWLSGPGDSNNIGEIYQCSHLRLVAADAPVTQSRGVCNAGGSATSSPTTSTTGVSVTPTLASPFITPTTIPGIKHGLSHPAVIGVAVGVALAIAMAILIGGYALFRRRRRAQPTVALDFWVSGLPWLTRHDSNGKGPAVRPSSDDKVDLKPKVTIFDEKDDAEKKKSDNQQQDMIADQKKITKHKQNQGSSRDNDSRSHCDSFEARSETDTLPRYEDA